VGYHDNPQFTKWHAEQAKRESVENQIRPMQRKIDFLSHHKDTQFPQIMNYQHRDGLNLMTTDIPGAQPKQVTKVSRGLKRGNFFDNDQIESLHMRAKYGVKPLGKAN